MSRLHQWIERLDFVDQPREGFALGVCVGITPFNFPAMVPMWMFANAIACGNTFVLKPSEKDPSVTMFVAELLAHHLATAFELAPFDDADRRRRIDQPAICRHMGDGDQLHPVVHHPPQRVDVDVEKATVTSLVPAVNAGEQVFLERDAGQDVEPDEN